MPSPSSLIELTDACVSKIQCVLNESADLSPRHVKELHEVIEYQKRIQSRVKLFFENPDFGNVDQSDLKSSPWEMLGHGAFGRVFKATLKGAPVAVKIVHDIGGPGVQEKMKEEGHILRLLRHDNIVAYRGMGVLKQEFKVGSGSSVKKGSLMMIMEFVPDNLNKYVENIQTPEVCGLPTSQVWDFGQQIISGLYYLHSHHIAHGDLKPDNILLEKGVIRMRLKLCDFGCAFRKQCLDSTSVPEHNLRWTAPEIWWPNPGDDQNSVNFFMRADIFSYGLVLKFMLTGMKMWSHKASHKLFDFRKKQKEANIQFPDVKGPLTQICEGCCMTDSLDRLSAEAIVTKHYQAHQENPYTSAIKTAEFFTCGFLRETNIVVADSLVDEAMSFGGRPIGYAPECLKCKVEVNESDVNQSLKHFTYETKYNECHEKWRVAAMDKEIDDNATIALKNLKTPREGADEEQRVHLEFMQSTYVHHRAMRDVWKSLDDKEKSGILPCKTSVHPVFSTSFGLHVAVLTADSMFVFTCRAKRGGMASPGTYTCGAVESCSIKDYVTTDDVTYVQLIQTAARGLDEELGVVLTGKDLDAICLSTVYLKFDNHEWGMCGFVDLSDKRIAPQHRLTFSSLHSRFTSGPKDKFEHDYLVGVHFELQEMTDFVRKNFHNFASSAKLVVVKVLQSFFGVAAVEKAFQVPVD